MLQKKAAPEWQKRDREVLESAATLGNHNKKYKNMANLFEWQKTDVKNKQTRK